MQTEGIQTLRGFAQIEPFTVSITFSNAKIMWFMRPIASCHSVGLM